MTVKEPKPIAFLPVESTFPSENKSQSESQSRPESTLRIALLGYRSHPYVGGQGIYLKYLSKALVELGHQVHVLSGPPYPELDPRVRLIKIPSLDLFSEDNHVTALRWQHLKSWADFFEWWAMLTGGFAEPYTFGRRVVRYMKQHRDDYDLVHDNQCLAHGLLTLQAMKIPTVCTIHHPITRDFRLALAAAPNWKHRLLVRRWYSFLKMQKRVAQKLRHVVTVSEQSRQDIASDFERPSERTQLIYNGIDTDTFRPLADVIKQPFRLMTTASADQPLKGLSYLLEAVAQLKPNYPGLELVIVGQLKAGGQTERQLQALALTEQVRFVSGIETEELVMLYNEASVAVTPSLYEGFGLPVAEAMACACAVVSSDGGALPEVVGDAGIVVPAGNVDALITAIRSLFDDADYRVMLEKKSRARILERFCWRVAAKTLVTYYRSLMHPSESQRR